MFWLDRSGVIGMLAAAYKVGKLTSQSFKEHIDFLNEHQVISGLVSFGEKLNLDIFPDNKPKVTLAFTRETLTWRN